MRELWIKIGARTEGLQSGLAKAQVSVSQFDKALQQSAERRQAINELGTAFGVMGLAAAGAVGLSVKAAVDWESAWAGVQKTVNGTTEELAALEDELREMARTMPSTHAEIAAVAEAAGQLGVATADVADFSRIMLQLGETTNLSADEAATSIAQLMNVMQTAPEDVDNLGAALVSLGNNGASTERDIIQMAQNLAGAGQTVGLAESEVLALANALASVGIEAEAGGSSVSRILMDMAKAVKTGSDDLQIWADVAGQSIGDFSRAFEESPARAFDAFTQGLGRINDAGGDVFTLLDNLGQSDIRVTRALLGMASSGDLLTKSLDLGAEAWAENTALSEEYEKRTGTAAAQVQIAWNGIKDNLIDVGAAALPMVKDLSEAVADLTGWFSDLPDGVQQSTLKFLALTAALGGSGFAVSRAITGFTSLANTLSALTTNGDALTRGALFARGGAMFAGLGLAATASELGEVNEGLGVLGTVASGALLGFAVGGPIGGALGAGAGTIAAMAASTRDASEAFDTGRPSVDEYAASLDGITASATEATRALVFDGLAQTNALQAAEKLGIASRDLVGYVLGEADARDRVNAALQREQELFASGAGATRIELANGSRVTALNELSTALGIVGDEFTEAEKKALVASAAIATWDEALSGLPEEVKVELANLNYDPTQAQIDQLIATYNLTPEQVDTLLRAFDQVSPAAATARDALNSIDGRVVTTRIVSVYESRYAQTGNRSSRSVAEMLAIPERNGAVLDFYRDGGMRENHVAQMAPAGAWRVWAEPETEGESYIPHARSKRQRSLEIWAETGKRLGVNSYAQGAVSPSGGTADPFPRDLARAIGSEVARALSNASWRADQRGDMRVILQGG